MLKSIYSLHSTRHFDWLYSFGEYVFWVFSQIIINQVLQQVVVLKDKKNKIAHESSAQLACEAAAAIRTVASLTREEDCVARYSKSLEEPLQKSNKSSVWSNMLFAFSQAMAFFVISLIFWYGSRLVASGEVNTRAFFICLIVFLIPTVSFNNQTNCWFFSVSFSHLSKLEVYSHSYLICLPPVVPPMIF